MLARRQPLLVLASILFVYSALGGVTVHGQVEKTEKPENDPLVDREAKQLVNAFKLDDSGMNTFMQEYWSRVAAMLPPAPKRVVAKIQKKMFQYALSDYHGHSLELKTRVFRQHFTPTEIHTLSHWFQSNLGSKSLKVFSEITRDLTRLHHRYVMELVPEMAQELELLGYPGSMDELALPTLGLQSATDLGTHVAPEFVVKIVRLMKLLRTTIRPELAHELVLQSLHHLHFNKVPKGLYKSVTKKVFAHLDSKLEKLNVKVVANYFTEDEVDQLTHFYSSPIGSKIEEDLPGITAETMHLFFPFLIKKLPVVLKKYKQELRKIGHGSPKWDQELPPRPVPSGVTSSRRYEPARGVPKHVVTKVLIVVAAFVVVVFGLVFYFREQIIDGLTFGGKDSLHRHAAADGL